MVLDVFPRRTVALCLALAGFGTPPVAIGDAACTALARSAAPHTEIVRAELQPAMQPVPGAVARASDGSGVASERSGLPEFCRVAGRIHPEPGSDIRFEVWMPSSGWNGRYMGVGNGGLAGTIRYRDLAGALRAGYATASTDTGHAAALATDADWARNAPAKLLDYGWRAIHLTAVNAKRLIRAYYGTPADRSYFQSCSNGGRQGLMEAARFPEDYDGILAGAPAAEMTRAVMAMVWVQQAQRAPGAALRPEQMKDLEREVLAQCDALDGRSDGVVDDPRACRFDPSALACGASRAGECFSAPQLDALRKIYAGPPKNTGRPVAHAYPATGAEVGRPVPFLGWDGYLTSGGRATPQQVQLAEGVLGTLMTPPTSIDAFSWRTGPKELTAALGPILDVPPNLSRYFARGGKLIVYHGWADAAIPPTQTIEFYGKILRQSGPQAAHSARLFMIPGMQHCYGGTGAELFGEQTAPQPDSSPESDIAAALRDWVERGRVPDSVIGRSSLDRSRERLHCAFPSEPVPVDGADASRAANHVCRVRGVGR